MLIAVIITVGVVIVGRGVAARAVDANGIDNDRRCGGGRTAHDGVVVDVIEDGSGGGVVIVIGYVSVVDIIVVVVGRGGGSGEGGSRPLLGCVQAPGGRSLSPLHWPHPARDL